MKDTVFKVLKNSLIAKNTYEMILSGDTSDISASGQFVNIKLDGFYLRRPISVCDISDGKLTIIYKAVGAGTEKMAEMGMKSAPCMQVNCGPIMNFKEAMTWVKERQNG